MKNRFPFFKQSISTRLLLVLFGFATLSVLIIAYLSVSSIEQMGRQANEAASRRLRRQAEDFLLNLTLSAAELNSLQLEHVRQDTRDAAEFAVSIIDKPENFTGSAYWRAEDQAFKGSEGQLINSEEDVSTIFVPNFVDVNEDIIAEMEQIAYMDFVFAPTYESDPNSVAIWMISKSGPTRYYPNIGLGSILPPDYEAREGIFYDPATPKNNPDREVIWTPIYADPAGQGVMVSALAPVYATQGQFFGVLGIDIALADLKSKIESASPVAGGYTFLINEEGLALALPPQGYEDILERSPLPGEFGSDLSEVSNSFAPILTEMMNGIEGFQSVNNGEQELFVTYAPIPGIEWSLALVVPSDNVLQAVADLEAEMDNATQDLIWGRILPVGVLILTVALLTGLWFARRLVAPLQRLAIAAQQIGAGNLDQELPPAGDNEVGLLSHAFGEMAGQLQDTMASLEQRVAERTAELASAMSELEAAMEMTAPVTQVWDGVLLLPLVGALDGERARDVMDTTLTRIAETEALTLIIDISGIPVVDKEVASHLIMITRATRLMGCESIISGISPAIAETITELGIDINSIETATTLQNALSSAMTSAGAQMETN